MQVKEILAKGTETEPLCPLCDAAAGVVQYAYSDIKIIRCNGCGLWRTCPRLSAKELDAYYEQHHYSDEIQQSGNYENWRAKNADVWETNARLVLLEARRRGLGGEARAGTPALLDVGSGHGFFLDQCRAQGITARGIETSPHAVKFSREQLKLDVRQIPLDDLPPDERYDVITLWGVLEHVPHPLRTMEQVRAHLNPGGMTWVMTPNTNALERYARGAQYFNFLNKSHLTHFHRATLKALLEKAGFKSVRRTIHWGGGARRGLSAVAQYAARRMCWGTELRFVAENYLMRNSAKARKAAAEFLRCQPTGVKLVEERIMSGHCLSTWGWLGLPLTLTHVLELEDTLVVPSADIESFRTFLTVAKFDLWDQQLLEFIERMFPHPHVVLKSESEASWWLPDGWKSIWHPPYLLGRNSCEKLPYVWQSYLQKPEFEPEVVSFVCNNAVAGRAEEIVITKNYEIRVKDIGPGKKFYRK